MQNYDDCTPEERVEQNQPLIQKLQYMYRTNDADAQSHARMRERLLAGSEQNNPLLSYPSEQERLESMHLHRSGSSSKRHNEAVTWQRYLSLIAAVLFVTLLVGSLVLVLSHARQSTTSSPNSTVSTAWTGRQSQLTDLHMFSATTGWAEGSNGTILHTSDGGIHWQDATPKQMPHTTLWSGHNQYISATTAWIAVTVNKDSSLYYRPSTTSLVFHTTDGGQTWQESTINTGGYQVGQITFANAQDGWLLTRYDQGIHVVTGQESASPSNLFRTTNGGKTWVKVLSHTSSQAQLFANFTIVGMNFGNQSFGLLTGMKGTASQIYMTNDGGSSWQLLPPPWFEGKDGLTYFSLSGIGVPYFFTSTDALVPFFFDQNSDFALYITHNGGVSWNVSPSLHLPSEPARGIYGFGQSPLFINAHDGWIEGFDGQHGVLYATTDGGQHWTQVKPKPGTIAIHGVPDFVTLEVGWAFDYAFDIHTGNQSTVLYETTDGGHSWKQVHAIFPSFIVPKSAFTH